MATFVKMPKLGLTMLEGTIMKWLKQEGDIVAKGDPLVLVESDKSSVEYESPESGILRKIIAETGTSVPILKEIAIIGEANEELPSDIVEEDIKSNAEEVEPEEVKEEKKVVRNNEEVIGDGKKFASPSAKRMAKENGIDINLVSKKPDKVRVEKADVLAYIESNKFKATPLAAKIAGEKGIDISGLGKKPGERIYSNDLEDKDGRIKALTGVNDVIPVSGTRKVIAARMKESLNIAAQVSVATEVDMTNALVLKNIVKDKIANKYDSKISINDIIVKTVSVALKENPRINCEFTENEIIMKGLINIGVAVALDEGLIVPVIKDVDSKGLGEISKESKYLIDKARSGNLLPDEYSGGTFTVSNLGMYDITDFSSIINQPESAILSAGKIVERPVVINGDIVIRPIMKLTLTFDHRPIDGATAAIFLRDIKHLLEEPYEMMI